MTFAPAADPANPQEPSIKGERVEISSGSIALSDLLSWYRAFHQGVAEQFEIRGSAALHLALTGWPPRMQSGEISSAGAVADGGRTPVTIGMEKASLLFSPDSITLPPVLFSAGTRNGQFRFTASLQRAERWHSSWKFNGTAHDSRPLFDAAESLGFSLPPGWRIDGPAECNLAGDGRFAPSLRTATGTTTASGLKIAAPFLNHEISGLKA